MFRSCVDLNVFSCDQVRPCDTIDIANGLEAIPVTVNMPQHGNVTLLPFNYICNSIVSGKASLGTNVSDIGEEDCCYDCERDCMTADRVAIVQDELEASLHTLPRDSLELS
jgi:hypothetical protein